MQATGDEPDIGLGLIMRALGDIKTMKTGGPDDVVAEMWQSASWEVKMRVAIHLRTYALGGGVQQPQDWREMLILLLPKESHAVLLDKHRQVGLLAALLKWYMKILLEVRHELRKGQNI